MASASALNNISNQPARTGESKSAKKKRAAAAARALEPPMTASKDSSALNSPRNGPEDGMDNGGEREPIREALKQLRNVTKKLNSMQKVDGVIRDNPSLDLDELVAAGKINKDQKAQALKKPQLQAQRDTLEEHLTALRRLEAEYQTGTAKREEELLATHALELEAARDDATAEATRKAEKEFKKRMLTFSRFLCAAANRRNAGDETEDENRAFEGALLLVYGGEIGAVEAAEKIMLGVDEPIPAVDGKPLHLTFARVKELALQETGGGDNPWEEDSASESVGMDPTIANAGLTELEEPTVVEMANGTHQREEGSVDAPPPAASIDPTAANAVADSQWDPTRPGAQEEALLSESYELVQAESGKAEKSSWSDLPANDSPEVAAAGLSNSGGTNTVDVSSAPAGPRSGWVKSGTAPTGPRDKEVQHNVAPDGFHEVTRGRGMRGAGRQYNQQQQHRGNYRGYRGRMGEGEGRGRGGRGNRGRGQAQARGE